MVLPSPVDLEVRLRYRERPEAVAREHPLRRRVVQQGRRVEPVQAKLTEGAQILAINGIAYDADVLKDAIRAAHGKPSPIELIVKIGDRYVVANLDYHDGLRYPHLERDAAEPARLDEILAARP